MSELVDVVIGVSIGILAITSAHLSENKKQSNDDGDKIWTDVNKVDTKIDTI